MYESTIAALLLVFACVFRISQAQDALPGRYVVTLCAGTKIRDHVGLINSHLASYNSSTASVGHGWEGITKRYQIDEFVAYAAHIPSALASELEQHSATTSIEPDTVWNIYDSPEPPNRSAHIDDSRVIKGSYPKPRPSLKMPNPIVQAKSGWPLGIVSHVQISARTRTEYLYDESAGEGTYGYIIGTGIDLTNDEFEGRARLGYSAIDKGNSDFGDDHGHGTAVAGVVGSKTFGVAKKCNLLAVKVADRHRTTVSAVLDGFQWATRDIRKRDRMDRSVVLFTLAGPASKAMTRAINIATAKGVTTISCAGDNGKDIPTSPGAADTTITVAATDDRRRKMSWADWGADYVHLFAPGDEIKTTWKGRKDATAVKSGSSLAAGYVAGIVLYWKGLPGSKLEGGFPDRKFILKHSLKDEATVPGGTALFAYNASGK